MEFDPSQLLSGDRNSEAVETSSLIILNQPIKSLERLETIWRNTSYRICADGGANILHDLLKSHKDALHQNMVCSSIAHPTKRHEANLVCVET